MKDLQYYLTVIPAALIAISIHEMSHAWAAWLLGDRTAQQQGRLNLNPLSHIDPVGFLCMIFFGFGWAKPVPVNPYFFKNRKVGMAVTAVAGPVSNFILGFLSILAYVLIFFSQPGEAVMALGRFLMTLGGLSIGLGVFNLLPIPPLDGSKVLFLFLPNKAIGWFYQYEGYIRLALLLGLYFGAFTSWIGAGQSFLLDLAIDGSIRIAELLGLGW
ncbi:MAG: site-2 protease family protein [Clostridia bacterium]|nr:site-2 protease family protein [Clostridia bacterium]